MRSLLAMFAALMLTACANSYDERAEEAALPLDPADTAATADAGANAGDAVAAADDSTRLVCVEERVTGSRLPRRVCHTAAERTAMQEESQRMTRDLQRAPYQEETGTN